MPAVTSAWFNTQDFSAPLLILFGVGCFGWVVAYFAIIRNVFRNHFLEIPAAAVVANIAWEFVWGFLYPNELGRAFSLGYQIWFFFDLVIVYALFRWGWKQVDDIPDLVRLFRPACVFGILAWGVVIFFMVAEGYDTGYGAISGYVLNAMMSALYVVLILRHHDVADFSLLVAWSKMLGTALLTVFNFIVQWDNPFLLALCTVTLILDLVYIGVFYRLRAEPAAAAA